MGNEAAVRTVALDHISSVYLEYMEKRRTIGLLAKEMEKLEARLRKEVGDNEQATIMGEVIITNRPVNKLRAKELEQRNPDLYKQYLKPKLVEVFDAKAFQAENPNLYSQFQSRQFLFKEAK